MKRLACLLAALGVLFSVFAKAEEPLKVELLGQRRLHVAPAEYSGIAYVGDNLYALVDDGIAGAGLCILSLSLDRRSGVHAFAADPGADIARSDNEDLVYIPAQRTIFVVSEREQRIREYDLAGRATGREVTVPEELKAVRENGGFEALAYDGAGDFLWTMTEMALPGAPERERILQGFSTRSLEASARYLYETDAPENDPAGARAHVFGVSALTALPDGRLLVLEREVYVPSGSLLKQARQSYTLARIYLTTPAGEASVPLKKELVTEIRTGAARLANFEGMCLGAPLPDGRASLLLLADSERGMGGLTKEYVYVLAVEGIQASSLTASW